jgi:protein-disulfide isomerase
MNTQNNKMNNLSIPAAIVIAGLMIAVGIASSKTEPKENVTDTPEVEQGQNLIDNVRPITAEDHILGDPNAPVKIVEYSDFECPFCKRFHGTMNQVMDEYGENGQVAWIYRHFSLDSLHPVKARLEAATSECVAEIGGNDAFWQFAEKFFAVTPSNNRTDVDIVLPQIIGELGLSQSAIEECITSGKYDQHIQDDIDNAIETGGRGTPWSIVIAEDGSTFPISGSQPYALVKQLIEIALQKK